jgi:hypothetical protein
MKSVAPSRAGRPSAKLSRAKSDLLDPEQEPTDEDFADLMKGFIEDVMATNEIAKAALLCWICNRNEANSGEHKTKRSDLLAVLGKSRKNLSNFGAIGSSNVASRICRRTCCVRLSRRLYASGRTDPVISAKFNCTTRTLRNYLRRSMEGDPEMICEWNGRSAQFVEHVQTAHRMFAYLFDQQLRSDVMHGASSGGVREFSAKIYQIVIDLDQTHLN